MKESIDERLLKLRKEDVILEENRILDKKIGESRTFLRYLNRDCCMLKEKNKKLEILLNKISEENHNMEPDSIGNDSLILTIRDDCDFFDQLRTIESYEELNLKKLNSLKTIINNLSNEIKTTSNRQDKLMKEIYIENSKKSEIIDLINEKRSEIAKFSKELEEKNNEYQHLYLECNRIGDQTKKQSDEMLSKANKPAIEVFSQAALLKKELENRERELQVLFAKEKEIRSQNIAFEKRRNKEMLNDQSPLKWLSERAALVAKVKRARSDLTMIENREKSVTQSTKYLKSKSENSPEINIKRAVKLEILEIEKLNNSFLLNSIEVEKSYSGHLKDQISNIEKTINTILSFKGETIDQVKHKSNLNMKKKRINMLKNEVAMRLSELKID